MKIINPYRFGGVCKAWEVDGVDEYMTKSISNFRSGDFSGTICATIKIDSAITSFVFTSSGSTTTTTDLNYLSFHVRDFSGNLRATVLQRSSTTANTNVYGNTNLSTGVYYHIALTSNASRYKMYVDGVDEGVLNVLIGADNGDWFADSGTRDKITIGALERSTGNIGFFDGRIKNVYVFDRELSVAEINDVKDGDLSGVSGNLVNGWDTPDTTTTVAIDNYGSDDLTLTNMTAAANVVNC